MTAPMTADQAQGVVPLPWFFGLVAAGLFLILLRVSWERLRDARQGWAAQVAVRADDRLDVLPEPELSVPVCHPGCAQAAALFNRRARWTARHWTSRDDERLHEFARSVGGA